jgi:3-hydroxybutyryl-CoA dehydratase
VTAQAPAHRMGARPSLPDAPATGAPAESVPAEELALTPAGMAAACARLFERLFQELSVGDRFETAGRTVREPDILQFADLTGDAHPQHVDPDWAAGSRFGEQIAHGLLVISFAVGLLPLDANRVVALRRVDDAVFKRPVKIGDALRVEGKITALKELDPDTGLVETALRILNQDGRLVVRVTVELVWRA